MPQIIDLRPPKKVGFKKTKSPTSHSAKKGKKLTKLEWTAPEFIKYEKGKRWFILVGLIALSIIIIAVLLKNFLWVVITILIILVVYIYASKEPRKIKFSISGKGIQIDQRIYRFENLKSFWIFYESASPAGGPPEIKELSLRSKKMLMPYIKIPLDKQNPAEIRKFLLKFLPERKHRESAIDELARRSKF